jgi:hypothetical protein
VPQGSSLLRAFTANFLDAAGEANRRPGLIEEPWRALPHRVRALFNRSGNLSQKEFRGRYYDPRDDSERARKQQKVDNEPGHDTLPTLRPPPRAPGFRPLLQHGGKATAACLNLGAASERRTAALHSGRGAAKGPWLRQIFTKPAKGFPGVLACV